MSAAEAFFKQQISPYDTRIGLLEAGSSSANAALFQATSTTSNSIPTSGFPVTRTFATQAGKAFVNGQFAQITDQANPANYMQGQITYSGTTLVMTVVASSGSGTKTAWDIGLSGPGAVNAMNKSGDTMTGPLILSGDPTTALQAATKAYVDGIVAVQDAMVFKGVIDASANPNYPDANRGWTYRISVAGKIGGASGVNVEAGDVLICLTDNTTSGNQAGVGANWSIVQANLDGVLSRSGGTMTGPLVLAADPAAPLEAVPQQYVDARFAAPQGRLTLTTAVPITTSDVLAATTIRYAPHLGDKIPIFDGAKWKAFPFTELSLALDATNTDTGYHQAGKNFDLFVINDSGTIRLVSGPAWASDTIRSAGLSALNGLQLNTSSMTVRYSSGSLTVPASRATYVGTFRATANGQTEDSSTKRFLWNAFGRRPRALVKRITDSSWTYTTNVFRPANNDASYCVEVVTGQTGDMARIDVGCITANSSAGVVAMVGVGVNSTTTDSSNYRAPAQTPVSNYVTEARASWRGFPGSGYTIFSQLESGPNSGTQSWQGTGFGARSGLIGEVWA